MIPNYQEFMQPFLEIAHNAHQHGQVNEVKFRDLVNQLADQFNLTEEERTATRCQNW